MNPGTAYMRNTSKRAFSLSGEWENVHFGAFYSGKTAKYVKNVHFHPLESGKTCMFAPHIADAPRYRVHAKYVKDVHFHPLASGKTCISAHSTVKKRQNTSKTCIFTLWRVGKRACSRRTSRMHPGTAYMQNTSKTCIFTLWRVGKRVFRRILQ